MGTGSSVFTGVLLVCIDTAIAGVRIVVCCAITDNSFVIPVAAQ